MPHRCKKNLIFLAFFLDGAIVGQPSGWCGTSAGRGQELAWHGPRRCRGRDHCLGSLAWLEPRAACAAGVTDCGVERSARRDAWLMSFGLLDLTRTRLVIERNEEIVGLMGC
ncbi:hypothetical protein EV1_039964 [Malus domestica]